MLIASLCLLLLFTAISAASKPIGTLEIGVTFSSRRAKLPSGENCDSFFWNYKCDIFFIICVGETSSTRECNLYYARTHPARNVEILSDAFTVEYTSDQMVNLTITVMDHDRLSSPDFIAGYTYSFLPSELVGLQEIHPTDKGNAHFSTEMRVQVRRRCKPHFYGSKCIPCDVPEEKGYCDSEGLQICHSGYFGPGCSQYDFCGYSPPCAPFAVCENTEDSFKCLCDGTSGRRCEVGFDPCEEHICLHNGMCTAVGVNRNFAECVNCDAGWSGLHCEEKVEACVQEERRLGRPPCANGGHCVNRMNGTVLTCLCEDGWRGPRCEMSFVEASAIVVVIAISLLALLAGCIFALVCCFRVCLLPRLRPIIKKQKGVEMQSVKENSNGVLWRANNLYEELGTQSATAMTKSLRLLDHNPPPGKIVDDADYEEYETVDTQQYDPIHTTFAPASAPESVDEEAYEPLSVRFHDEDLATQTPNSGSVYVNNEEYEELTEEAVDRPLPVPPTISGTNKDFYKRVANSQQVC
ncbi:Delta-like protein 3 [Taenia solium]|eukprot:TsM_000723700 transcript=TsM_000723700 gene=TsM_000723700